MSERQEQLRQLEQELKEKLAAYHELLFDVLEMIRNYTPAAKAVNPSDYGDTGGEDPG